jgi:uncharacterized FAD-dependent dehydrogenase
LIEAHPHIGTNKLPQIIQDIREKIIECGGQVLFETRLTDILVKTMRYRVCYAYRRNNSANKLILATGHSARDILNY